MHEGSDSVGHPTEDQEQMWDRWCPLFLSLAYSAYNMLLFLCDASLTSGFYLKPRDIVVLSTHHRTHEALSILGLALA